MSAPHSHLQAELDHYLSASLLGDAMLQWRPRNHTAQRTLSEELLAQSRACANILAGLLEHRTIAVDNGGGADFCDAWDLYGLSDLLGSLLEITTIVTRRDPDNADRPESTTDTLWLSGSNGNGCWVDALVREPPASADPNAVTIDNGLLHPASCGGNPT